MSQTDTELFDDSFGEWLEAHGVELISQAPLQFGTWKAMVDLSELKAAILARDAAKEYEATLKGAETVLEDLVDWINEKQPTDFIDVQRRISTMVGHIELKRIERRPSDQAKEEL